MRYQLLPMRISGIHPQCATTTKAASIMQLIMCYDNAGTPKYCLKRPCCRAFDCGFGSCSSQGYRLRQRPSIRAFFSSAVRRATRIFSASERCTKRCPECCTSGTCFRHAGERIAKYTYARTHGIRVIVRSRHTGVQKPSEPMWATSVIPFKIHRPAARYIRNGCRYTHVLRLVLTDFNMENLEE